MMKTQNLYRFVWMSRPLMQAAEANVEKGLAGTDLTVRMRAVLAILRAEGDLPVPEIAAKLDIQRQYVQVMVNETLASDLTAQRPNPRHKRSPLLTLTDTGRTLIDTVVRREMEVMERMSAGLSDADIATALSVIQTVTERLKAEAGGS